MVMVAGWVPYTQSSLRLRMKSAMTVSLSLSASATVMRSIVTLATPFSVSGALLSDV